MAAPCRCALPLLQAVHYYIRAHVGRFLFFAYDTVPYRTVPHRTEYYKNKKRITILAFRLLATVQQRVGLAYVNFLCVGSIWQSLPVTPVMLFI